MSAFGAEPSEAVARGVCTQQAARHLKSAIDANIPGAVPAMIISGVECRGIAIYTACMEARGYKVGE